MSATATNPLPVREVQHTEIPSETIQSFKTTLSAMRSHYKATGAPGQAPAAYAIPVHLLHLAGTDGVLLHLPPPPATVKTQVAAMANAVKTSTESSVSNAHQAVSQALNTLNSNKDLNAFHNALEQQRTSLKAAADGAIDKAIDTAEKIGDAHPEAISGLMKAIQDVGTFFSGMASSIYNFFKGLVNTIANAIKAAAEWLVNAGKTVAGWASSIVNSLGAVGGLVSSILSIF